MKTFNQLSIDDKIFVANVDSYRYEEKNIVKITSEYFTYYYDSNEYRLAFKYIRDKKIYKESREIFFANKTDAIRYCKAQMMKELFNLVESAHKEIEKIKKFRLDNIQLLNHDWTDSQINKLEKEVRQ